MQEKVRFLFSMASNEPWSALATLEPPISQMSSRRSKDPFTFLSLFWMVLRTPCKSLYVSILAAHSCSIADAMSIVCKWVTAAVLSRVRSYLIDNQSSKMSWRMMH